MNTPRNKNDNISNSNDDNLVVPGSNSDGLARQRSQPLSQNQASVGSNASRNGGGSVQKEKESNDVLDLFDFVDATFSSFPESSESSIPSVNDVNVGIGDDGNGGMNDNVNINIVCFFLL